MSRAAELAGVEPPTAPAGRFLPEVAADAIQRPSACEVSINERRGRQSGDTKRRPCLPTAWLLKASAADLNQRRCARVVA